MSLHRTATLEAPAYTELEVELQQAVGRIARVPQLEQADEIFGEMTARLETEYRESPERYQDAMLQDFMANPKQSVCDEMLFMSSIYQERSLTTDNYDGSVSTEFVTRNIVTDRMDALYRISETRQGKIGMTIMAHLQGSRDLPCMISYRENDDQITVAQTVYRRGWHQREVCDDEQSDKLLRGFFASTIWAARLKMSRSTEEQLAADARARELLLKDRLQRRGSLVIEYA